MGCSIPGESASRALSVCVIAIMCLLAGALPSRAAGGALIETVSPASEPAKAGLQPGDLVQSWSASGGRRGAIESPFDLAETGIEEAPRGVVTLHGQRNGQPRIWRIHPSTPIWRIEARPVLSPALQTLHGSATAATNSDPLAAAAQIRKLAEQTTPADPPWLTPWLYYRAAELALQARKFDDAATLYRLAVENARRAEPYVRAQILASWAQSYYVRDWQQAANYLAQSLAEYQKIRPLSLAVALLTYSRGEVEKLRERFEEAEPLYRGALEIAQKVAPGTLAVAYYLNNAGSLAMTRNHLIQADDYFRRALTIRQAIAPDTIYTLLNNLGSLAYSQEDLTAAADYYTQSLSLLERIDPVSPRQSTILGNLAVLAAEKGELNKASQYLRRSLALLQKSALRTLNEARVLSQLGGILRRSGDLAGAERHFLRALEIRSELAPNSLTYAQSLAQLGTLAAMGDQKAKAEEYHRRALAIREKLAPSSGVHADSLLRLGATLMAQGRLAEAEKLLATGLDILERATLQTTDESLGEVRARFVDNYRDYIDLLIRQNRLEDSFHAVERSRARALLAMLAERPSSLSAGVPAQLDKARRTNAQNYDRAQDQLLVLNPARDAARIESLTGRLRALDIERQQIAAEIRSANPRLAAVQYPQPLTLSEARKALDSGTHLISYSVGANRTVLFAIAPAGSEPGFHVQILPVGERDLQARVESFRRLVQNRSSDRAAVAAASRELYDLLLKPVEGHLAAAVRLVIAPDGPLHGLPFAALRPNDTQYLIEWKPLHTVLSATIYAELKKSRHPAGPSAPLQIVAFGDPRIVTRTIGPRSSPTVRAAAERGLSFGRLPFSRDEVNGIARLYPGAGKVYLQAEATEERAKSMMSQARVIHFATHAILDERLPVNAALVLSIPEKRADGQENGLLQAWEIFDQTHMEADLVVLSACQTGLGKELRGEGLIGLTRAFQYAGAHSVIASLWSVDDRKTADLMRLFYVGFRDGATKDVALQAAQRQIIRSTASHPFYWAAFTLSGDWR